MKSNILTFPAPKPKDLEFRVTTIDINGTVTELNIICPSTSKAIQVALNVNKNAITAGKVICETRLQQKALEGAGA